MADFKITRNDELMHYRTKGSKNGVRLYQNPDGSLTPLGERHYRDLYGYGAGVQRDGASDKYKSAPRNPNKYYESVSRAVEDRSYRLGKKHTDMDFNPYYQRHVNQKLNGQPYGKSYKTQLPTDKLKNPENFTRDERWEVAQNIIPQYNTNKENREQLAALREKTRRSKLTDYERAKEDATKWVVDRADDVKKGATDAYNSASKWVVDRTDDVKKGATDAYNRASDAAVKVGDAAKNAYNDASKWVVDRADDVKKGATDAYNRASDAAVKVGDAAKNAYNDASKWVVDRADDVKKGATDAYNKASKAVVDTADKVKKGAEDAYNTASKAVVDTADKVKKGVSDAYDATSKAVVDAADETRYAAERTYNSAKNAVTDVVDRVKNTYGPGVADVTRVISELPKNLNDPHLKEGLDNSYNAVKEWVTTAADDVKKTSSEAFDAGKEWVEQAGKDVGDFVNNAVSDVTKAVDDAKNGVVDAANTVGKAAQDGWNWVKGLFGGGDDYGKDEDKDRSNHSSSSHKM